MKLHEAELVKWREGEAWNVGCIMRYESNELVVSSTPSTERERPILVKLWPTGELEFVHYANLESREVRSD